jgi:hypothetical protein
LVAILTDDFGVLVISASDGTTREEFGFADEAVAAADEVRMIRPFCRHWNYLRFAARVKPAPGCLDNGRPSGRGLNHGAATVAGVIGE